MQHDFKSKNLGKGIRSTLAIILDPKMRKVLTVAAVNTRVEVPTTNNNEFNNEEMHTLMEYTCKILTDDDFVKVDETNLFQESSI